MTPYVVSKREISIAAANFADQVTAGKRTLAHMVATFHRAAPADGEVRHFVVDDYIVGDLLLLFPSGEVGNPARVVATITKAELVPLDVTEDDCAKLCVESTAHYVERWDRLHPMMVYALRPIVWRIEWRYPESFGIFAIAG